MIEPGLNNYTDYLVTQVIPIHGKYGYRVVLKYTDRKEVVQQKSGFALKKDAYKARDGTIAELHTGTYIVYDKIKVNELLEYWLEEDIKKRTDSHDTYYSYCLISRNHIIPEIGNKRVKDVDKGDIKRLYNKKADYSVSVARQIKAVINIAFKYAVNNRFALRNPAEGVSLPKAVKKKPYHTRAIDTKRTLTLDQMLDLVEKSKDTPIHMQVLFNALMGLRRGEINGVRYADVDYVNHTLTIERQLGKKLDAKKEDYAPKTLTKQEIDVKTESSHRVIPIPDYVYEAILEERKKYEKNRSRRSTVFQDLDYICCSSYGRPRSKSYHFVHYKKLLKDAGLPDIRWHDLRATFCTLLLKNGFNPKAVSKLMGHAKEIITMDVYGDNREIISDGVAEITEFMKEVLPERAISQDEELLDIVPDVDEYLHKIKEETEETGQE